MKKILFSVTLILCMLITAFAYNDPIDGFENGESPLLLQPPQYKWGDDILILSGDIGDFDFATDYNSGNIYAIVNTWNSPPVPDTMRVYKSVDNGLSWTYESIAMVCSGGGDLLQSEIVVTDDGKIGCFGLYMATDGEQKIYMREFNDSTFTGTHFEQASSTGDTVETFDMDYCDGYYYITYTIYNGSGDWDIFGTTCHEDSSTWDNHEMLFTNATHGEGSRISAGMGGAGYVAFIEERSTSTDTLNIRCKRTFDYGVSWENSVEVTNLHGGQEISEIDIACCKPHPELVWITTQFSNLHNWGYYLSTDSCETSSYVDVIMVHSGWDEYYGTVESHPIHGWATFAFRSDSSTNHNVAFFYNNWTSPSTEVDLQEINDHWATGTYRPEAGNIISNSAVVYAGWGPADLYFDSYINHTGINDNMTNNSFNVYASPAMFNDCTDIYFMLGENNNVSVDIFNTLGQRVWSHSSYFTAGINSVKWSGKDSRGSDIPEGVYFFRVNNGSSISSGKMTLF